MFDFMQKQQFKTNGLSNFIQAMYAHLNDTTTSAILVSFAVTMRTTSSVHEKTIGPLKMSALTRAKTVRQWCPPYAENSCSFANEIVFSYSTNDD